MNTFDAATTVVQGAHLNRSRSPLAVLGLQPPEWFVDALCAQVEGDLFFPDKGGSTREAKIVCSGCPVRTECLQYALEHEERYGIWGGLSERERRRIRRGAA